MVIRKSRGFIKKSTIANEVRLAKITGSIVQPASGALPLFKGDFKNSQYLFDNKKSFSDTINLSKDMFKQLIKDAKQMSRTPCLSLTLMNYDFWILPIRSVNIKPTDKVELIEINKFCKLKVEELRNRTIYLGFELDIMPSIWILLNDKQFIGEKHGQ
ncbi:MAG: hypothetical protein KKC80_08735 [Candidatus Margulisbacteria bacterium]|nr:hypothetical protein [Candidatus Margulisiibacteriota bacterium]